MAINNFIYVFVRTILFAKIVCTFRVKALNKSFTPVKAQFNINTFNPGKQIKRQIVCSIG